MFGVGEVDIWDEVDDARGLLKEPLDLVPVPKRYCLDCRNGVHDDVDFSCSPEFCDCEKCPELLRAHLERRRAERVS